MRLLIAATILVLPAIGAAQSLTAAAPSADSVAQGAPQVVELTFSEDMVAKATRIMVRGPKGERVDRNPPYAVQDARHLAVDLKQLAPGRYQVIWKATSRALGKASGSYAFTVSP